MIGSSSTLTLLLSCLMLNHTQIHSFLRLQKSGPRSQEKRVQELSDMSWDITDSRLCEDGAFYSLKIMC